MKFAHRPVTADDAAAAAEVVRAYESAFFDEPDLPSSDDMLDWWKQLLDDGKVAVTDGERLVGIGTLRSRGPLYEADNFVDPEFVGQGIGTFLLDWGEERARRDGVEAFRAVTLAPDLRARELFDRRGLGYIRSFYRMLIDLDQPPAPPDWPQGFSVAPLRKGEERLLFETVDEAFMDHWGYVRRSFEEWSRAHQLVPDLTFLVRENGTVVAAVINQPERFGVGWVDVLAVRARWRRRGLGEALLRLAFHELYERGPCRIGLGVDASNTTGATRLYERVGMRIASQADVYEKRLDRTGSGS